MDFALSPEHEEIRRTVRDFAERRIAPVADELERKGEFPREIVQEAASLGLLGVPYPESVGGTGLDTLAYAITIEELSRVSGSVGIIVSAHTSLGCNPLYLAGTDEQKERYLRPLASGQRLGAYGLTEPGAGSDSRGTRTRARRDGDCWILDGSKRFITNAGVADTYIVTAVTEREAGTGRISAFIVEADTPGFSIGRMEEKMGLHASNTGELLFDDCRIPLANLLGEEGEGDKLFLRTLDGGRIGIGAMALGLAQAAYEAAAAYAKERRQFDRPIGTFQGVAFMISDMATEIDAARLLVYRAAWLKDQGRPYTTEAAMAKLFASETAQRVTNAAIQVHGGYGYITEYKVERYLRDAKLTEIGEGTSQIQRLVIARNLLGMRAM
jgi:butyryl-CoA dehydrogenase